MDKRDLCREAGKNIGVDGNLVEKCFDACLKVAEDALLNGDRVYLHPIGILFVRYDRRAHVKRRLLRVKPMTSFDRELKASPVEIPPWFRELGLKLE